MPDSAVEFNTPTRVERFGDPILSNICLSNILLYNSPIHVERFKNIISTKLSLKRIKTKHQ